MLQATGLISGIDVQSIIDRMVEAERVPIVRLEKKIIAEEARKTLLRAINSELTSLQSLADKLGNPNTFLNRTVSSSDESILTATASSDALLGSYDVTVLQLATASKLSSGSNISAPIDTSKRIVRIDTGSFKIDGIDNSISLDEDGTTLNSIVDYINTQADFDDYSATYDGAVLTINKTETINWDEEDSFTGSTVRFSQDETNFISVIGIRSTDQTVSSTSTADVSEETTLSELGVSSGTFTINGWEYEVTAPESQTIGDVIDAIESNTGVTAEIVGGKLKFSRTNGSLSLGNESDTSNFLRSDGLNFQTIETEVSSYDLNLGGDEVLIPIDGFAGFRVNPTLGDVTIDGNVLTVDLTTTMGGTNPDNAIIDLINGFSEIDSATYNDADDTITIKGIDDTRITFGSPGDTSNLITALRLSPETQVVDGGQTTITSTSRIGAINPNAKLSELNFGNESGPIDSEGTFKVNGVEIEYSPEDTLQDVINRINSSDADVTAFYNEFTDKVEIVSDITGNPLINLEASNDGLMDKLDLFKVDAGDEEPTVTQGQNAIIVVDGTQYVRNQNSIDDVIPGITIDLKSVPEENTDADPENNISVKITVAQDVNSAVNSINDFVEQYNAVQDLIRRVVTEKRVFQPETEDDLVKGVLANDTTLRMLYQRLYSLTINEVPGLETDINSLSDIGISHGAAGTVSVEQVKNGLDLKVDEVKLQSALYANPVDVANLFGSLETVNVDDIETVGTSKMNLKVSAEDIDEFLKDEVEIGLEGSSSSNITLNLIGMNPRGNTITLELDEGETLPPALKQGNGNIEIKSIDGTSTSISASNLREVGNKVIISVSNAVLDQFMEDTLTVEDDGQIAEDLSIESVDSGRGLVTVVGFLDSIDYDGEDTEITKVNGIELPSYVSVTEITPEASNIVEFRDLPLVDLRKYSINDHIQFRQNGTITELIIINEPVESVSIELEAGDITTGDPTTTIIVDESEINDFVGKDRITIRDTDTGAVETVKIENVDTDTNQITVSTPDGTPDLSGFDRITEIIDTIRARGPLASVERDGEILVGGIAEDIEELISDYTGYFTGIISQRISNIDSRIEDLNEDISEIEQEIAEKEQELINEYAELEVALGQIQTQSMFLEQQLEFLLNSALYMVGNNRGVNNQGGIFG